MVGLFFTHWLQFNYAEPGQPFYRAADWPNVFVDIPLVIGAYFLGRARHITVMESHRALKAVHVEHAAKLDLLLDRLDPEAQGSIRDVLDRLQMLAAKLDSMPGNPIEEEPHGGIRSSPTDPATG